MGFPLLDKVLTNDFKLTSLILVLIKQRIRHTEYSYVTWVSNGNLIFKIKILIHNNLKSFAEYAVSCLLNHCLGNVLLTSQLDMLHQD